MTKEIHVETQGEPLETAAGGQEKPSAGRLSPWVIVAVLALVVGAAFYVFSSRPTGPSESGSVVPPADGLEPLPVAGHPAPDFTLQTLEGATVALSDFRGEPVIVNFWASWCGPCRLEMPHLQDAHAGGVGDVNVLGVNLTKREGDLNDVSTFVEEFGLSFPVVLDESGEVADLYEVRGQPASVFINADGQVHQIFYGPVNERFIQDRIAEMADS